VATTSQPLPLEQATFSLRLLSQWTSWLLLVVQVVEGFMVLAAVLEATELPLELAAAVLPLNRP
jgi:hypothetical protein